MRTRGDRRGSLVAAAALVAGLGLAALALPRAVGGFLMLPGERDLVRIQDLKPVGEAALARAADSREAALRWTRDGRLWTDLALARLMRIERRKVVRSDTDIAPVRRALVQGLALAPLNPYAWSRLAYIDYAVEGPGPSAALALPVAILSGPAERRLYLLRAELGLRLWRQLDEQDRPLVLRQLELGWHRDPLRTLEIAAAAGGLDHLRRALGESSEQQAIMDKLLARGL